MQRFQPGVETDGEHAGVRQFAVQHLEDQPFAARVEGVGGLFHEKPGRLLQQHPREAEPLLRAQRQHAIPVVGFVEPRREPGDARTLQRVADQRRGPGGFRVRVAQGGPQTPVGQEGTLRHEQRAAVIWHHHPSTAPWPQPADHLE